MAFYRNTTNAVKAPNSAIAEFACLVGFNTILEPILKTTIKHLQDENKET